MINIEIDGKAVQVEQNSTIIAAADKLGIKIPRFCYHKKLSIVASCRMCLVEVNNLPKPQPSCATIVAEGMKIKTQSAMALAAQKSVMEFLLINHPLDCPTCDQGGECELQDTALVFGTDVSRFNEGKRIVEDKNIGPLIATDMTKCIHCTRCVRFGDEIAGQRELGALYRGEFMQIDTYIEQNVGSEISGNIIDLCPVGALTSKPFKYSSRPWDLKQYKSIAPHDCLGSNIYLHVYQGTKIKRVAPYENEQINEVWLSDRDRFSYEGIHSDDRAQTPLVKENGKWQAITWTQAFDVLRERMAELLKEHSIEEIGALYSHSSTTEEIYLLQKIMRALGCENIDGRLTQSDFSDDLTNNSPSGFKLKTCNITELAKQEVIVVIGSNTRKEQPLLATRLREASKNGAKIVLINPADFNFNLPIAYKIINTNLTQALSLVLKALLVQRQNDINNKDNIDELLSILSSVTVQEDLLELINLLMTSKNIAVVLGSLALSYNDAADIKYLTYNLSKILGASVLELTIGSNAMGAKIAHGLPKGLNATTMLTNNLAGYFLLNIEPEYDSHLGSTAVQALLAAKLVVSLTPYITDLIKEYADLILPIATFAETSGTFVNCVGQWQSFSGAIKALHESRPAWKVLRVMANTLQLSGFNYSSSEEILAEIKAQNLCNIASDLEQYKNVSYIPQALNLKSYFGIWRIATVPLYAVDNIVRRAHSLQQTNDAKVAAVFINENTMHQLTLKPSLDVVVQGNNAVTLPLLINNEVPNNTVIVPRGILATAALLGQSSSIELLQE